MQNSSKFNLPASFFLRLITPAAALFDGLGFNIMQGREMQIQFITDTPIDHEDKDHLQVLNYVKKVSRIIINSENSDSHNIGIYGDWGKGKTSFLKLVQSELESVIPDKKMCCVFYQAWRFDSDTFPLETLVGTLIDRLEKRDGWYKSVHDHLQKVLAGLEVQGKVNVLGNEIAIKHVMERSLKEEIHQEEEKKKSDQSHLTTFLTLYKQVEKFKEKSDGEKIVLFLDDLDRCQPDVAIRLLEGLKQIFDFENFFIVMGLNKRVLDNYVKNNLKSMGVEGSSLNRYFEKIFKTEIILNDKIKPNINNLLSQHLKEIRKTVKKSKYKDEFKSDDFWEGIERIIKISSRSNPRAIVKTLNELILQLNLYDKTSGVSTAKELKMQFFDACFKYVSPSLHSELKISAISRDCYLHLKTEYGDGNKPFLLDYCNLFSEPDETETAIDLMNLSSIGDSWLNGQVENKDYDKSFLLQGESMISSERYTFLLSLVDCYLKSEMR